MSQYGYFLCEDCKVVFFLGKAVFLDDLTAVKLFHRGSASDPPNWSREILNRVLWKMLADHVGHRLKVVLERDLPDTDSYRKIGGDDLDKDIDIEAYIRDS